MQPDPEADAPGAAEADDEQAEEQVAEEVEAFLLRNFPQIAMHGGSAAVESVDEETGEVWLRLGGACSGCGISPMTIQAIQARLPQDVEGVSEVRVDTGFGATPSFPDREGDDPRFPEAPF